MVNVGTNIEAGTDFPTSPTHDLLGVLDLLHEIDFKEHGVMDQHRRHDTGFAQPYRRQPQHVGTADLHREIKQRAFVGLWLMSSATQARLSIRRSSLHVDSARRHSNRPDNALVIFDEVLATTGWRSRPRQARNAMP